MSASLYYQDLSHEEVLDLCHQALQVNDNKIRVTQFKHAITGTQCLVFDAEKCPNIYLKKSKEVKGAPPKYIQASLF